MKAQTTERTEAASGKGDHHEPPPHDGLRSEATTLNELHWNNVSTKPVTVPVTPVNPVTPDKPVTNDTNFNRVLQELTAMHGDIPEEEDMFDEEEDERECKIWINQYARYVAPIPKFLIVKDAGRRRFSGENVMRRTAWLGKHLNIKDKNKLPEMRKIEITKDHKKNEKEQVIAISTDNIEQARLLLQTEKIGPCQVTVDRDERKNTVKGVLVDHDGYFKNMSTDEMVAMLASEGVLKVDKLGKDKSKSYKITFNMLSKPDRVKLLGVNRSFWIQPYIPSPLRCYRCQQYNHASSSCRLEQGKFVCQRCGGDHQHKVYVNDVCTSECTLPMKCIHCKLEHQTGFFKCPTQIKHVEVNKLMVNENLSRYEAKNRVFSQYARSDAKVITSAIRVEESKKEVEAVKKREAETNLELAAMNKKLQHIMTKVENNSPPGEHGAESLDAIVRKAVDAAILQHKEETNTKLNKLLTQITELNKTVTTLNQKNTSLEAENKKLRNQLLMTNKPAGKQAPAKSKAEKRKQDTIKEDRAPKAATGDNREAVTPETHSQPPKTPGLPTNKRNDGKPPDPQSQGQTGHKIKFRDASTQPK